jgi:hypothetical protein
MAKRIISGYHPSKQVVKLHSSDDEMRRLDEIDLNTDIMHLIHVQKADKYTKPQG